MISLSYREIQQALKAFKEDGYSLTIKLNAKKSVLIAELKRLQQLVNEEKNKLSPKEARRQIQESNDEFDWEYAEECKNWLNDCFEAQAVLMPTQMDGFFPQKFEAKVDVESSEQIPEESFNHDYDPQYDDEDVILDAYRHCEVEKIPHKAFSGLITILFALLYFVKQMWLKLRSHRTGLASISIASVEFARWLASGLKPPLHL